MIKSKIALIIGILILFGCNDKPEVQPVGNLVLSIYPNPASTMASIRVGNQFSQPFTLHVFDTKGRMILEKEGTGNETFSVNLANEPKGKYQVILKIDNTTTNQNLLKL